MDTGLPKSDVSSPRPSSIFSTTPEPSDGNGTVASPAPATHEVTGNNKVSLLTIPVEIRLQIYREVLICRFSHWEKFSLYAVGKNKDQKMILLNRPRFGERITCIKPLILHTCKQIYHEAVQVLYSENVFFIDAPDQLLNFACRIGNAKFKVIKTLHIEEREHSTRSIEVWPWLRLFDLLAKDASGLRCIQILWKSWRPHDGLGDNVAFVRAFGAIQGLEKLTIGGYYAKNWPAYLEKKMGVQVRTRPGHYYHNEWELKEGE